jgi:Txe/YoeB family toxin of toxin-antitoxin system
MLFALQFTKFLGLNPFLDTLIKDIKRNPFEGIGKPKPLKHALLGYWSRRINDEQRIVYIACADFIKTVSETFLKHFFRNVNYLTLSYASLSLLFP